MALISFPFEDGETTEAQYSALFRELGVGVAGDRSSNYFKVTADSTGMNVKVQPGPLAIVRGHAAILDLPETLTIEPSQSTARIDAVVLRLDPDADSISLRVVRGTAGPSPSKPALEDSTSAVFDLALGYVQVGANVVTIPSSAVSDARTFVGRTVKEWTTDTRPTGAERMLATLGYNSTLSTWEWWNGAKWTELTPTALDATIIATGTISSARLPTVPVSKGGTGATTAAAARTALGVPATNHSHNEITGAGGYLRIGSDTTGKRLYSDVIYSRTYGSISGETELMCITGPGTLGRFTGSIPGSRLGSHSHTWGQVTGKPSFTSAANADTVMMRGDGGRTNVGYPNTGGNAANKTYVEDRVDDLQKWANGRFSTSDEANKVTSGAYSRQAGSSRYAMWMDGSRLIGRATSSRRYKDAVAPWDVDTDALLTVEPKTFHRKVDAEGVMDFGAIAEEIHDAGLHELVDYDEHGRPDAIREHHLPWALLALARRQATELEELRARLDKLEAAV